MYAHDLVPQPRCQFVGEFPDTGEIARCGRWSGHNDEHLSRKDVLDQMCQAVYADMATKLIGRTHSYVNYIVTWTATDWYHKLVLGGREQADIPTGRH